MCTDKSKKNMLKTSGLIVNASQKQNSKEKKEKIREREIKEKSNKFVVEFFYIVKTASACKGDKRSLYKSTLQRRPQKSETFVISRTFRQ